MFVEQISLGELRGILWGGNVGGGLKAALEHFIHVTALWEIFTIRGTKTNAMVINKVKLPMQE